MDQQAMELLAKIYQTQTEMRNEITNLREMRNEIIILRNDTTILRADQETIAQNVAKIEMVLEHKVAQKISALFDFREIQIDHNQKIEKALERIEAKIEDLQLETSNLRRIK